MIDETEEQKKKVRMVNIFVKRKKKSLQAVGEITTSLR